MKFIREIAALMHIGQTHLSVLACRIALERARQDLELALRARDQAAGDLRIATTEPTRDPPRFLLKCNAADFEAPGPNY